MVNEKVHLRHIMLYEFRKGVSVGAAQKNISEVNGNLGPALRTVKKWFGRFRLGDFNLKDQPSSGQPSDIDNDIFLCSGGRKSQNYNGRDSSETENRQPGGVSLFKKAWIHFPTRKTDRPESNMWDKLYAASKQNIFKSPFTKAECAEKVVDKKGGDKKAADKKAADKKKAGAKPADKASCEYGSPEYFFYCAIGGALSCGLTHCLVTPLDVVKCRMQTNPDKYSGIFRGIRTTIAEEGAKGLTRGWLPTLIGYSMQGACKFGFYEYFKIQYSNMFSKEDAFNYRTLIYLAASASAEFIADIALSPMESCKVKIQTTEEYGRTLRECIPKMMAEEGVLAFYKTLVPLWMRQIPYTMMKFACFERTIELLYQHVVPKPREQCTYEEQLAVTFAAGYIAGVFCAVVSHPADTLVSKMNQQQGCTATQMLRLLGFKGLWSGLGTRIFMIGTLTGLQWFIYDGVKVWLGIPRPPPPSEPAKPKAGAKKKEPPKKK